ncbi:MAG: ATP-binding cassette domain-containing protein [Spirochaetia bacterium]|jgi:ABC-type branched-subunit amino acid transport system ATPase component|nr:ATP-binding cassette domain-containing protein [Spirochaetales bacterium]MDX9784298.1 ATP-binding cassette domain-containing protein [Spirochaetia bacterium]
MGTIISTAGVVKQFGEFKAVAGVDLEIEENETVAIIGPNGAGKTTFLNILTGLYLPEAGSVYFRGKDVTVQKPEARVASGVLRTFQIVQVFDNLTVYENMALSYYRKKEKSSMPANMFFVNFYKSKEIAKAVDETLALFDISSNRETQVGNLSLGLKKKLEIAMSWIADPDVLILDEPFAGIGDQEIDEILTIMQRIQHKKTIILVEHKVSKLSGIVDKLAVMSDGKLIAVGSFDETMNDPVVRESYWKISCEEGEEGEKASSSIQSILKGSVKVMSNEEPADTGSKTELLKVEKLDAGYGQLKVVFDVSLNVNQGEIVMLAGRNGAGKTTLFRTICGFLPKMNGRVNFRGEDISSLEAFRVAQKGIKYIHQDKTVFRSLTVRQNFELSSYATKDYNLEEVLPFFPKLRILMDRKAEALSGGERQMLLMAMALLGNPPLVLMDEPTEGLAPHVIEDLAAIFKELKKKTTLFIVEQNLPLVASVADRVYSMKEGKIVAETSSRQDICNLEFERYL